MKNTNQNGNVLFLILIAVALFAALSYAVTQSSRSGGDAGRETNVLNAAQITQYPTAIRTAITRLIIDGYQDTNLLYNEPSAIAASDQRYEVFHPVGGGAVYQSAPSDMMELGGVNTDGTWFINMDFEVPEIGVSAASDDRGNDVIAFLPDVTESVCTRINMEAGLMTDVSAAMPVFNTDMTGSAGANARKNITGTGSYPGNSETVLTMNSGPALNGNAFGCFEDSQGAYIVYVVLLER